MALAEDRRPFEVLTDKSALDRLREDPVLGYGQAGEVRIRRKAEWRQVVLARARKARHELLTAWEAKNPPPGGRWGEEAAENILKAREAALQRVWPWSWFEGCAQEQAWLSLHEADAEIIELVDAGQLPAYAEGILEKGERVLCGDRRVQDLTRLLEDAGDPEKLRVPLVHLARAVYDVRDDRFAQTRDCRNRMIRLTSLALLGSLLGLIAGAMGRLDFNVAGSASIPRGWETVVLVVVFGAVGALVSAIPPLAKADGKRNPFSLPLFQLFVKLALGPVFALIGVLVLQDRVISGLQPAATLRALILWATIFGASQQTVTRVIDQRVTGILHQEPGERRSPTPARAA